LGDWQGEATDEFGASEPITLRVAGHGPSAMLVADTGGERCFLWLDDGELRGLLPGHGPVQLRAEARGLFCDEAPPDSAGEFQLQLRWHRHGERWDWRFRYGLRGTTGRGAERHWSLVRATNSPPAAAK